MERVYTVPSVTEAANKARRSAWKRFLHTEGTAYLFLFPFLVPFVLLVLAPAIAGVIISFFRWSITGTPQLIGLENYARLFKDYLFIDSVENTLRFMALAVPTLIVLSLALAVLLNQRLVGRSAARAVIVAPRVLMVSAVGIIWGWMYNATFGLLNYYLIQLGLKPISWLADTQWAMPSIVITTVWWTINTNVIIYLAGLQDISVELYEAGKIDGANAWQLFWNITLPSLRPLNAFVIPMSVIASSRVFGQIYTLTAGGPVGKTFVIVYYIYTQAFQNFRMGLASAAAVLLTVASIALTLVQLRVIQGKE
jgi:multiple sugar transport system permease protein